MYCNGPIWNTVFVRFPNCALVVRAVGQGLGVSPQYFSFFLVWLLLLLPISLNRLAFIDFFFCCLPVSYSTVYSSPTAINRPKGNWQKSLHICIVHFAILCPSSKTFSNSVISKHVIVVSFVSMIDSWKQKKNHFLAIIYYR